MREYMVRMTIRTNENPDKEIYYEDEEIPSVIREWFDGALEDRDDGPRIEWSEFRQKPTGE